MATQQDRAIAITTPLGEDVLVLRNMTGREELGRLFQYDLSLASDDNAIKADDILGQNVTIRLDLADDKKRYFNGVVSRFAQTGRSQTQSTYHATIRPWLWFLTRRADCRIFQEMSVPDIVKAVFKDYGPAKFDLALSGSYDKWTYCVQYRETDFNFVSRLMEQEGIYYYFKHEDGSHTMMLCDSDQAHSALTGNEEVPFRPPSDLAREEHIYDLSITQEVLTGAYSLQDFDFEKPGVDLTAQSKIERKHENAKYEFYDYPGEYLEAKGGKDYAKARIEELQWPYEQVTGAGTVRGFHPGGLFKLIDYPREDQNREYLVVSANHDLNSAEFESGGAFGGGPTCMCGFTAIDSKTPFRTPRKTAKPIIQGPQTAIVVGPAGDEIYTDKYGRIKVQFHWDRQGKKDENSSCWIRVAQVWAGAAWGGIQIPRIGQEVMVEFLEGDPDQPIITGRVYNAEQMPPYGLPDNATQSGIKSRSTKGGGDANFNEIRMEDKKGSEELYIHAEKNHTNITENDRSEDVGHDRTLHVGHDKSETIDNNKAIKVTKNHDETIGANKTISVGANHTESVGSEMSITVGSSLSETVAIAYTETVGAAMALTVGAAYQITVGATMNTTVGGAMGEEVGLVKSVNVGGNSTEKVGGKKETSVSGDSALSVGKSFGLAVKEKTTVTSEKDIDVGTQKQLTVKATESLVIQSDKDITIQSGDAKITLKKDGSIELKGSKINIKADGDVKVKGGSVALN
jgi:type VI secretion system secreted protein VgrG